MYKRLLASTALVAAGMVGASAVQAQTAPASQPLQVSVGGYFEQTFGYADNDDGTTGLAKPNEWAQFNDSEIHFNVKGTLANGISVGARVELEANSATADQIDESFLFVEGAFGRLELGTTDEASKKTYVGTPGIGKAYTTGLSTARDWILRPGNVAHLGQIAVATTGDDQKISYYTPRFAGLQVGASFIPNDAEDSNTFSSETAARTNVISLGANFTRAFGGVNVEASLGYSYADSIDGAATGTAGADEQKTYAAGLRVGFAGFTVGGGYQVSDTGAFDTLDGDGWELGVSYTFGPATVGIQYITSELQGGTAAGDDKYDNLILGANYTLGPGVDLFGNIFNIEWENETSGTNENNKGTGAVAGLRLTF